VCLQDNLELYIFIKMWADSFWTRKCIYVLCMIQIMLQMFVANIK